jgi:hypothetical protein
MKIKNILLAIVFSCVCFAALPAFADVDITVTNNADVPATVELPQIPVCGINLLAPGDSIVLLNEHIKHACRHHEHDCLVNVFSKPSCDGTPVAQLTLDVEKGVVGVKNFGVDDYSVQGMGGSISLEKVKA